MLLKEPLHTHTHTQELVDRAHHSDTLTCWQSSSHTRM